MCVFVFLFREYMCGKPYVWCVVCVCVCVCVSVSRLPAALFLGRFLSLLSPAPRPLSLPSSLARRRCAIFLAALSLFSAAMAAAGDQEAAETMLQSAALSAPHEAVLLTAEVGRCFTHTHTHARTHTRAHTCMH